MNTLFLNDSRNGWWDIGSSNYMYAKIEGMFEYGRLYEDSVEFTFINTISPKGNSVFYDYAISAELYINGVLEHTFNNLKPTTNGYVTNEIYDEAVGVIISGLSAFDTSATWKMVYKSTSGYTCEAQGVLMFDAYDTENEYVNVQYDVEWYDNDNTSYIRPSSITINLYADGSYCDSHVLSATAHEQAFIVPKYNNSGYKIDYSITIDTVGNYSESIRKDSSVKNFWHINLFYSTSAIGWKKYSPYVRNNGSWVKATNTVVEVSDSWRSSNWMISDGSSLSMIEVPNNYGTTAILLKYTTKDNDYGTTVVVG